MKVLAFLGVSLLLGAPLFAEEAPASNSKGPGVTRPPAAQEQVKTIEEQRLDTIHYGTEGEIAALIQALKNENAAYLDDELLKLVENTRNKNILAGVFSFFGERNKKGLEKRAARALEERDNEAAETVLAAINYLGRIKEPLAIEYLEKILDSEERRFMSEAFRAMGRAGSAEKGNKAADETAEYLIDYYTNREPGDENRREIIIALGETGSKKGVAFLTGIAGNNEERVPLRIAALEALSKIGAPEGLDAVLASLSSEDPNVRSAAVAALGPFSGKAVDDAILESFRDSYYRTRLAAASAAGTRKLTTAVPYLRYRAERDEVPGVKDEAVRALGAIGSGEAAAVLEELFSNKRNPDRVRILAAEMLINHDAGAYADRVRTGMEEAKKGSQTPLYNGLLRVISGAKTKTLEDLARSFFASGGVMEKSYALDMTGNNEFRGLIPEVRALTDEKNGSLSRKAKEILRKLGEEQ
jgi:HEAT repeat protein